MMRNTGAALYMGSPQKPSTCAVSHGESGGLEDFNESGIQSVSERAERECMGNLWSYVGWC